jgi:hypothetical protein
VLRLWQLSLPLPDLNHKVAECVFIPAAGPPSSRPLHHALACCSAVEYDSITSDQALPNGSNSIRMLRAPMPDRA